jgi:aspartyl-tRNA(Asn)/glutamyl-tRNA(Gln) amidotransferase subunit C
MKVNDKLVERLAHLSRLEFDAEAKIKMKSDFEKILDFVDQLESVDTDGIEPLVYMSSETNVLRVDKVKGEVSQQDALKNAGGKDTDYIRVPKVIKQ